MTAPLFRPVAPGVWRPDKVTRGPFDGMQGGAAAALMCALIEGAAREDGLGFVASTVTHFIRPAPLEDLTVAIAPLRVGKRMSVLDATLASGGKIAAVQRATCIKAAPSSAYPTPPRIPFSLADAAPVERSAPRHGQPYMMDAMERWNAPEGVAWFRLERPILGAGERSALVMPAADWAHGLAPPSGAEVRPPSLLPNTDLSIHIVRPPAGAWIGVRHGSAWSSDGIGVGFGELLDEEGFLGRVAMSVAVTLLGAEST